MSTISAQSLDDVLQGLFLQASNRDGTGSINQLSKLVMPVLSSLEAETSMKDVQHTTSKLTSAINTDGSANVHLPSSIGEPRLDNIRVAGPQGLSMGA